MAVSEAARRSAIAFRYYWPSDPLRWVHTTNRKAPTQHILAKIEGGWHRRSPDNTYALCGYAFIPNGWSRPKVTVKADPDLARCTRCEATLARLQGAGLA